jgi:hypothetical protein
MTFPVHVIRPGDNVLCVFSAAFLGRNAEAYIRDAGHLQVTCVDSDAAKLEEMRPLYPPEWKFVAADAHEFRRLSLSESRDVVVLDPWTQHVAREMVKLPEWCALARRAIIVGATSAWFAEMGYPPTVEGLRPWLACFGFAPSEVIHRSDYNGGVWWIVAERAL